MNFARIASRDQRILRTFEWRSDTHEPVRLKVQLEYIPPRDLNEKQEANRTRILSKKRFNALEDVAAQAHDIEQAYNLLLTTRIHRIDGLTLRGLKNLVSLDPGAIKEIVAGTAETDPEKAKLGVDMPIDLDPADQSPVTDQERVIWQIPEQVANHGQAAVESILYLMNACTGFRDFVAGVVQDVSFFQDADWESQIKN
jgi:hypothetical protein